MIGWREATIGGFLLLGVLIGLLALITRLGARSRPGDSASASASASGRDPGRPAGRVSGRTGSDRIAGFGETLVALGRRRGPRAVILFCWAWLGWHFLSR